MNSNEHSVTPVSSPDKRNIVSSPSTPTPAIPIISFPTSTHDIPQQPDTPTALSCPWEHLPARCRNEPAVVACPTGQVRRMRSVLDMRLGPMAGPTNITMLPSPLSHPASPQAPSPLSSFTRTSSSAADSHENLSANLLSKLVIADEFVPYSPTSAAELLESDRDRFLKSSHSTDDIAEETSPTLDVFGIPIPALSPTKSLANDHDDEQTPNGSADAPLSFESDAACSVLLAESPSSLDLSALLC